MAKGLKSPQAKQDKAASFPEDAKRMFAEFMAHAQNDQEASLLQNIESAVLHLYARQESIVEAQRNRSV